MDRFLHDTGVFFGHLASVNFGALAIALGFQALRVVVRTRAWRNIIVAAYPDRQVRWRSVLGAYLAGVGLNAITPARSGDVLKLYLVKHRVEGSTYPTLAATLVVETLFDAVVGITLLLWAVYLGVLPNIHSLPNLPNIDLRWAFEHPLALEIGALVLGIAIGVLLVWATARVRAFWARVRQGFAILRDRRCVPAWRRVVAGAQLVLPHCDALLHAARVPSAGDDPQRAARPDRAEPLDTAADHAGRRRHRAGTSPLSVPGPGRAQRAALLQRRHAHRDRRRERRARPARDRVDDAHAPAQSPARVCQGGLSRGGADKPRS